MIKICSWIRPNTNIEDSFYYDDQSSLVLIYRNGEAPSQESIDKLAVRNTSDAGYNAPWMLESLQRKNYDRLMPNMQKAYDFLNATLGV